MTPTREQPAAPRPLFPSQERGKFVTAADAARLIRPGNAVATGGFVGIGFAEQIAVALEDLFLDPHEASRR